ncbi:MAG TPA: hypothetical protein VHS32_26160 [Streptosporangiaceae bacterium]|jgi:hypothetical protein|nr:hypothetical protein [Streptosporangiaceae bacterium]
MTKFISAGQGAEAGTSLLTTVTTRPGWRRFTRVAIWAASVDFPMPPIP